MINRTTSVCSPHPVSPLLLRTNSSPSHSTPTTLGATFFWLQHPSSTFFSPPLNSDQWDLLCGGPQSSAGHTRPLDRSRSNSICTILCIDRCAVSCPPPTPSVKPQQVLIDPNAQFLGSSSLYKCGSLSCTIKVGGLGHIKVTLH